MIGISLKNSPAHSLSPPRERAPRRCSESFARCNGCVACPACQREPRPASLLHASPRERFPASGRSIQRGRRGGRMEIERRKEGKRKSEQEREERRRVRQHPVGARSRASGTGATTIPGDAPGRAISRARPGRRSGVVNKPAPDPAPRGSESNRVGSGRVGSARIRSGSPRRTSASRPWNHALLRAGLIFRLRSQAQTTSDNT